MPTAATLVLRRGKIITVDRDLSIAEAVAIDGHTILHVGSSAEMQPFIGAETQVIELQEAIGAEINRALVGRDVEVLVEGPARRQPGWMMGKTPQMKTVAFPGPAEVGALVRVHVESSTAHSLRGFQSRPGA